MELILKKRLHFEEQISKDFELLKQLEDEHRLASDPQEKARLKRRIDVLNEEIEARSAELFACQNSSVVSAASEAAAQEKINTETSPVAAVELYYALSGELKTPPLNIRENCF